MITLLGFYEGLTNDCVAIFQAEFSEDRQICVEVGTIFCRLKEIYVCMYVCMSLSSEDWTESVAKTYHG